MKYSHNLLSTTCLTAALLLSMPHVVRANPLDGVVSAGQASILANGKKLNINQQTNKVVIDWRGFDIAPDEHTEFFQPNANSVALNRVHSSSASQINGNLTANGHVVIVNQNGILFGQNAKVDVNGLIATTADIDNDKFMSQQKLVFDKEGNPNAVIVNNGQITVKEAGLVGFVAPNVVNNGVITAHMGRVHLASGDTATVDLYGDGLLQVAVSDKVTSQLVANRGLIEANGGTIALTAAAGKHIVNSLIDVKGRLKAQSVGMKNGQIIISAEGRNAVIGNAVSDKNKKQGNSNVIVQASLDVSGRQSGEHGGKITVTGDQVALLNGTFLDASGSDGLSGTTLGLEKSAHRVGSAGGEILIGGNYLGQGTTPNAENLYVGQGVVVLNDALNSGDAGRTIFWSDKNTQFYGNVYARAFGLNGDGGFVETSGHDFLDAKGYVNLLSANGHRGTYFLDPTDITIVGNTSSVFSNSGLVGYWNFNEGSGSTAADSSGNGHTGTLVNGPSWSSSGAPTFYANSGSLSFDGIDDYVDTTQFNFGLTDFSFSYWMQTSASNRRVLGQFGLSPTAGWGSYVYPNSLNIYAYGANGGLDTTKSANLADNAWHMVTGVYSRSGNNATISFYADGILLGTSSGNVGDISSNTNFLIGTYLNSGSGFQGLLDDVRVYNNAISANNVAELYGSRFTVSQLETMSATADISLAASNNITLDFQGDSLNLTTLNRSLTLTAGNKITTASAGSITTNGGGITLNATNGIDLNHAYSFTTNGGTISLNNNVTMAAAQNLNAGAGTVAFAGTVNGCGSCNLTINGGTVNLSKALGGSQALGAVSITSANTIILPSINSSSLSVTSTNTNAGIRTATAAQLTTTGVGGMTFNAARNIDFSTAKLVSNNGNVSITAGNLAALNVINSGTGSIDINAKDLNIYGGGQANPNALVGYWRFDENTGTIAYDSSGHGNNGTLMNGPTWSADIAGNAPAGSHSLYFDGSNDFVDIAPNSSLDLKNNFTVSLWYKSSDASNYQGLVSWGQNEVSSPGSGGSRGLMALAGGELISRNFNSNVSSGVNVVDGTWHNLTASVNSSNVITLYEDGVAIASGSPGLNSFLLSYFRIGKTSYSSDELTKGNIDNVRIYNTALSAAEIAALSQPSPIWQGGAITMHVTNDINLDLKGDTLAANSLSLTAGHDIKNVSAGTLQTSGQLTMATSGAGAIVLDSSLALNAGGQMSLTTAGGNITLGHDLNLAHAANFSAGSGALNFNGKINGAYDLTASAGTINFSNAIGNVTPLGAVTLNSVNSISLPAINAASLSVTTSGGTADITGTNTITTTGASGITFNAGRDINFASNTLNSSAGNGTVALTAARNVYLSSLNSGTGAVTINAYDVYLSRLPEFSGLVAYYNFEEGSGTTITDLSGNTNNGTLFGGASYSSTVPSALLSSQYSLSLNGSNAYASVADSNSLDLTNGFTFSLWMKSAGSQSNRYLLSKLNNAGSDNAYSVLYGYAADQTQFYASGNSYGYPSSSSNIMIGDTSWHQVTYTYNGNTFSTYKDGTLVGSTSLTANLAASAGNLLLGTFNGSGYFFNGQLDDVRIYNNALNASQIASLYTPQPTWQSGAVTINAAHNVSADLKGDIINVANNSNIAINAGHDIITASNGLIQTAGTGNIVLAAGNNITMSHDLGLNAAGSGNVTLRADNNIAYSGSGDITTHGGNIVVSADHDNNHAGSVSLGAGSVLTSGSGNIIVAGDSLSLANTNLSTAGRWLLYMANQTGNTLTGLTSNFNRYSCTYSGGCAAGVVMPSSGNGIVYAYTPILTVTPNAIANRTYGDAVPSLTNYAYTLAGYLNSEAADDSVTGSLNGSTNYTQGSGIGNYGISHSGGALTSAMGYGFSYANNSSAFTVNPRAITITPDSGLTKIYGAIDPTLTYQITSGALYGSDNFTGVLTRAIGETVLGGPYAISQGTLAIGSNYTVSFVSGRTFSITPYTLNVNATARTKQYGAVDPSLIYTHAALVNGDTNSVFSGALDRAVGSTVGSYAINQGTLSAGSNYTINYTGANFVINPATLTITANNASRLQGQVNPVFTVSYNGFQYSEDETLVSGLTVTSAANTMSAAGSYAITPANATAANYTIVYVNGVLQVNAAPVVTPPATTTPLIIPNTVVQVSQNPVINMAVSNSSAHIVEVSQNISNNDNPPSSSNSNQEDDGKDKRKNEDGTQKISSAAGLSQVMLTMEPDLAKKMGISYTTPLSF